MVRIINVDKETLMFQHKNVTVRIQKGNKKDTSCGCGLRFKQLAEKKICRFNENIKIIVDNQILIPS